MRPRGNKIINTFSDKTLVCFLSFRCLIGSSLCRFPESIDDIRMLFEKKNRKISRKRQNLNGLWEKLEVSYSILIAHACPVLLLACLGVPVILSIPVIVLKIIVPP